MATGKLWMAVNDLSSCCNFKTTLYADDSVLALSHKNVNCAQTVLNCELSKINGLLKSKVTKC